MRVGTADSFVIPLCSGYEVGNDVPRLQLSLGRWVSDDMLILRAKVANHRAAAGCRELPDAVAMHAASSSFNL